jgi:hypothetical protein
MRGMISMPASARRDYVLARAYLCRDRAERSLFDRLEHGSRHFHLTINHRDDDRFDPNDNTIAWDPYSALRTTRGGTQSPALGLGHEVAHAVEAPAREQRLAARPLARYDDAEERRVIRGSEAHAARTLGEGVRFDHRGSCYRVNTPVSR